MWGSVARLAFGVLLAAAAQSSERGVTPINPASWITTDDYPPSALRARAEGISSYRLDIDAAGQVTSCTITQTSGTLALDEAACASLRARARFNPARDRSGHAIAASYTGRVRWQIPNDGGAAMALEHFQTCPVSGRLSIHVETPYGCAN